MIPCKRRFRTDPPSFDISKPHRHDMIWYKPSCLDIYYPPRLAERTVLECRLTNARPGADGRMSPATPRGISAPYRRSNCLRATPSHGYADPQRKRVRPRQAACPDRGRGPGDGQDLRLLTVARCVLSAYQIIRGIALDQQGDLCVGFAQDMGTTGQYRPEPPKQPDKPSDS